MNKQMSIRDRIRQWYKNIPDLYHGSFRKKWIKALQRKGMRAAIDAKCGDCMCWQNVEVKECNIVSCPLFLYRPFSKKNGKIEVEIIAAVTEIEKNEGNYDV